MRTTEALECAMMTMNGKISKLDEQLQCIRDSLAQLTGQIQMLVELHEQEEEEDETDDEASHATTSDDGSDTDMSYIVEDHSSSPSPSSYDTDDSF